MLPSRHHINNNENPHPPSNAIDIMLLRIKPAIGTCGGKILERADLRKAASEAVLQVTDHGSMASLIKYGAIAPLCRLASRSTSTTGEDEASGITALEALVQLSSQGTSINQCIEDILNSGGINRMTEIALTPPCSSKKNNPKSVESWRKRVNFSLALLANMTRTERGAVDLCGYSMPEEVVHVQDEIKNEEEEIPESCNIDKYIFTYQQGLLSITFC